MFFESFATILVVLLLLSGLILQVFIPGFPKETLLLQSGILFGTFMGSLINWTGMVIAAQLAYEVVRRSVETGGKYSKILAEYQNSKFVKKLEKSGNYGLFVLRLLPFSPNDVLSLLAGALKLPRKTFFLVSVVTAIPFAVLFAYFGSTGADLIDRDIANIINISLMMLSITGLLIFKLFEKFSHNTDELSPQQLISD